MFGTEVKTLSNKRVSVENRCTYSQTLLTGRKAVPALLPHAYKPIEIEFGTQSFQKW